jgi:phosphoenolpyruvate-protein phosphotransferase
LNDSGFERSIEWETSGEITILSPEGFHARPAALLVKTAKKFVSEIKLIRGKNSINAKSLVSVIGMALRQGDTVAVFASGPDAKDAISSLVPILAADPGAARDQPAGRKPAEPSRQAAPVRGSSILKGIPASPGMAVGVVRHIVRREVASPESYGAPDEELAKLGEALAAAKKQLIDIEEKTKARLGADKAAIFGAHQELLEDPDLLGDAKKRIAGGESAIAAWRGAYGAQASKLAQLTNALFAARAADVEDVGRRVLLILSGEEPASMSYEKNSILIAEDMSPSDTANIDRSLVLGFCTVGGGATSHIAILARSLSLPAVVGMDRAVLEVPDGVEAVLDGAGGFLHTSPDSGLVGKIKREQESRAAKYALDVSHAFEPAATRDGHLMEVAANAGSLSDVKEAVSLGCDGIGLLRSEFLFLGRPSAPAIEEQVSAYVAIAKAVGPGSRLIVRTLDAGGDKPLAYIKHDHEENLFLGVRGLRLSFRHRDLFEAQLRAILRAAEFCDLHVMFPMVSTLAEFRAAKDILRGLQGEMKVKDVKIGVMVEIPSVAILAGHFAAEADFLSIGTNDLVQYALAADRGSPDLVSLADGLDPSILSLVRSTVEGARGKDCWVGVCGGLAGDPIAIPVLMGLGVKELSVSAPAVPSVKAGVRELSLDDCVKLASEVIEMSGARSVRERVARLLAKD